MDEHRAEGDDEHHHRGERIDAQRPVDLERADMDEAEHRHGVAFGIDVLEQAQNRHERRQAHKAAGDDLRAPVADQAAEEAGKPRPKVMTSRWSLYAANDDEAWKALYSWRGLRAPGRLDAVDPQTLREKADELPREEVLGRYSRCATAEEIVKVYEPLVKDIEADVITLQMAAVDQPGLIKLLGEKVLPALREMAAAKV